MADKPFDPFQVDFETDFIAEDEGDSGTTGAGGAEVEAALWWLDTNLKREIRENERKFSHTVPFTDDPKTRQQTEYNHGKGERLRSHPLFADTSQFQGIFEDTNNPSPAENSEAMKQYNEHQHRMANMPKMSNKVRLERR